MPLPEREEMAGLRGIMRIYLFKDIVILPRTWTERTYNLQHYTMMPRGGHFAPMEEPELLVEDIRTFFRGLRG